MMAKTHPPKYENGITIAARKIAVKNLLDKSLYARGFAMIKPHPQL